MNELSLIVKATTIVAIGLCAAALARRTRASVRHLILSSTFIALLLLPLTTSLVPEVAITLPMAATSNAVTPLLNVPAPPRTGVAEPIAGTTDSEVAARTWIPAWPIIVRGIWAAGALVLLTGLGVNLWRLRRLRRHGLPWTDATSLLATLATTAGVRHVHLLLHEDLAAPATCGWRQATVLLPSDAPAWSDAELRRALVHELEHVRRGDWGIHLMARATCAALWFHPLVWLAFGRLCLEAERACDDAVVQAAEHAEYADQLVQLARRMSNAPARPLLAMATRSNLATRVSAILNQTQPRGRLGYAQITAALAGAALLVLAVAPLRAVGVSPKAPTAAAGHTAAQAGLPRLRVSTLDRALLEAATAGDLDSMASLLGAGADVNGVVPGDGSPLIAAARRGRIDVVGFLLDRGADPNLGVRGDGNPLIVAAKAGRPSIVEFLLARGANIDQVVDGDENALIAASAAGQLDVVELLVTHGADVNARVWVDDVWRGPGVSARDGEWRTPLIMATQGKHDAVASYLRSVGAQR